MNLLQSIFTWWNGSTFGTEYFTRRNGEKVGEDEFGNVYYRNADDTRRWVIYPNIAEASSVTSDWHGWLHHTFDKPPAEAPLRRWDWEADHRPNMTGTALAYRPAGSLLNAEPKSVASKGAYEAWSPE